MTDPYEHGNLRGPDPEDGPIGGTNLRDNQAHRKADAAIAMRNAGSNLVDIADTLGYSTARTAMTAIERRLADTVTEETRAQMRQTASMRLERLLRGVWLEAIDPKAPDQLTAVSRARELIAQHAKLWGLEAPQEVIVHNPTSAEIDSWLERVMREGQPKIIEHDILGELPGAS